MKDYGIARICLSGHVISEDIEISDPTRTFCQLCGDSSIIACKHCNAPIPGGFYGGLLTIKEVTVPAYCHNCGKPYPWTEARLIAATNIINMLDELTPEQKQQLIDFIPDLIVETPKSQYAALIYAKFLDGINGFVFECLKQWCQKNVLPSLLVLTNMQK